MSWHINHSNHLRMDLLVHWHINHRDHWHLDLLLHWHLHELINLFDLRYLYHLLDDRNPWHMALPHGRHMHMVVKILYQGKSPQRPSPQGSAQCARHDGSVATAHSQEHHSKWKPPFHRNDQPGPAQKHPASKKNSLLPSTFRNFSASEDHFSAHLHE
jgi:hypothetical protein